ncbi:MAG: phosphoserine transaminase [Candidatus Raymondbacteria bacterium RifOxyA12_full_50_37]|uniref:Phosphoserine aminotransferase n=1 Tax=Candidatus Raymondbacteria bacterium RIFOXYD12_FULL_49_13 TaxID=1817890 RepID=A0A1F7EZM2_UNCRA|nr:MAG: phosphoserine transaminase [Candidatus Raymondbacteria bacterium RifOxyA12_full_50_37]OGJ92683.1 MAG: phosphoserine transaminase [Candidatus Raymondbacteria bacterium RIFOXYA2_FULL_49_16]OGJ93085.1 MAG: phosphoserine transaminase [Candidatus Raymondbacteria bacterium RifOxyC12_full_50_8]OGJ99028.1 MAG: phosphoserine transaminase [Candidatus Raymondbacteria bacterium RIFOXYC2_FULL_50_21]OGJ99396.1 MAG: phosphoserine transaminase [Candidatus Raymondbacteria bacterium RifOxyB12_full_50_8]
MSRVFNFNAGPSVLPVEALETVSKGIIDFNNSGMSILEMSHRTADFDAVIKSAESNLRTLLGIPEDYAVLFLGGGASLQFTMVAMNLLPEGATADYTDTGSWASKAAKEAKLFGKVNYASSSKDKNYTFIPKTLNLTKGAAYLHITSNNTIYGTQYRTFPKPETGVPLVADMSSDILSRPITVSDFGLIYAGAQKNMGPAGVVTVIVRKDLLGKSGRTIPSMLDYKVHAENVSLYNTPPVFAIYVVSEVLKWLKAKGGIAGMEKINERKAKKLYAAIDSSTLFTGTCAKEDRSYMNVVFVLKNKNEDLEKKFLAGAKERKLVGLKGHRSIGGFRASIYNAFPEEGIDALVKYMEEFAKANS